MPYSNIAQKTRAYAKRQETFWRMLKRSIDYDVGHQNSISLKNST